jgi:hypothetical protein
MAEFVAYMTICAITGAVSFIKRPVLRGLALGACIFIAYQLGMEAARG